MTVAPCKKQHPMIVRTARADGFSHVNQTFISTLGYQAEELEKAPLLDWIHPDDRGIFHNTLDMGEGTLQARHRTRDGNWVSLHWEVRSGEQGPVTLGLLEPSPQVSREQRRILADLGSESTMTGTLDAMVRIIEDQFPGLKCSIILTNEAGHVSVGAGPSLPASYNDAIEGLMIGPGMGSCGTASYWNMPVFVEDIQRDSLWKNLREVAASAGVAACWSFPITSTNGDVLGATALYASVPRTPTQQEIDGLKTAARMIGLAIERGRAEQALRESEARAMWQSQLLRTVSAVVTSFVDSGNWHLTGRRLLQAALELTRSECGFLSLVDGSELNLVTRDNMVCAPKSTAISGVDDREFNRFAADLHAHAGKIVNSRQAVIVNNPGNGGNIDENGLKLRSFLGSPIVNRGSVVAVIGIMNAETEYSDDDLEATLVLCSAGSSLFDSHRRQQHERSMEEQLRRVGKMEALGVLAGGVAHDFNNMLSVILGSAELAKLRLPEDSPAKKLLENIVTASQCSAELCTQMLTYAGRGVPSTERLECNEMIRKLGMLLQASLPKKTILMQNLSNDLFHVEADRAQFRQVVMNLITNASEAIGANEGRIVITTDALYYDDAQLAEYQSMTPLPSGEYVRLTLADDGKGMSAETQAKIFDPFYTTKFAGPGLGLAAVQGIVHGHNGGICIESEVGKGTTFTILLPRVGAPHYQNKRTIDDSDLQTGKRILVVDDEPALRSIFQAALEEAGFEVVLAADGQEAVEIFERQATAIDCVLLDLSMPRMGGEEAYQKLRQIRPDVRVVLTSGYPKQEIIDRFDGEGFAGFVQKPVSLESLVTKIRRTIESTPVS